VCVVVVVNDARRLRDVLARLFFSFFRELVGVRGGDQDHDAVREPPRVVSRGVRIIVRCRARGTPLHAVSLAETLANFC
jgi:hypothetical protein